MHVSSSSLPPALATFDYQPRTRLVCGPDSLEQVGPLARSLGASRALLVTDEGIVAAGHAARAVGFIAAAGLEVEVYDRVRENPTTGDVAAAWRRRAPRGSICSSGSAAARRWTPRRGATFC